MDKTKTSASAKSKPSPEAWIKADAQRQEQLRQSSRAALAPLAELLCALRLIRLDNRPSRYGSSADGRHLARGIDVGFDQGAPSVIVWTGDGGRMVAKPLAAFMGAWHTLMQDPEEPAEHAAFEAIAWKSVEALWKLGQAGCESAWTHSGASFKPNLETWKGRPRACLGSAEALSWMAEGSVGIESVSRLLLADAARQDPATRAAMESVVLAQVAAKPGGEAGPAPMRL